MPSSEFTARAAVEIDGSPLADELQPVLERVVVDDHLHLPDMFELRFRDLERTVLQQARIKIGSKVKITATALGSSGPQPLITGEVTGLEAEYDAGGARAVVRGYDASHRFHRGRRTDTYRNVKDSDIARTIAGRAGVEVGTIDDSGQTHDHVSQANTSDWEFLKSRGREIGFELAVTDGKLHFRKPIASSTAPEDGDFASDDPLKLVMGQELLEFHPRITSAQQVKEVQVRGWDAGSKKAVVGSAPAATTSADLTVTPAQLAKTFGDPTFVSVDRPLSTQAGVDAAAKALAEQIASTFAEAEGTARGNPKLKAGAAVSVGVVADDFAGRYTLTHTTHIVDKDGYRTQFVVSGRQERSLLGLASMGGSNGTASGGGPPIYGMVVAVVTNNDDPEKLCRVKLKFPWLSESYESDWARITQLGAGPDSGALFIPEVNDEVLVAFEFGDVRRPYVIGGLYNGKDKPRLGDGLFDNGKVKRRGFTSRKGHRIVLFDDAGDSGIALISSDNKLRISLREQGPEIHIYSGGKIKVESTDQIEVTSQAGLKVSAQGQLELSGQGGVKVSSSGIVEIKGSLVKLN